MVHGEAPKVATGLLRPLYFQTFQLPWHTISREPWLLCDDVGASQGDRVGHCELVEEIGQGQVQASTLLEHLGQSYLLQIPMDLHTVPLLATRHDGHDPAGRPQVCRQYRSDHPMSKSP